jgi:hypothetical protein
MEASEDTGFSRLGRGAPDMTRIDLDRVRATLQGSASGNGYARLLLMLDTVFPRLARGRENRG